MIDQRVLSEADLVEDPVSQFQAWFQEANEDDRIPLPEAGCLSTVSPDGYPDGRMVLLKGFESEGFVFYTNLGSAKAEALRAHPKAGLTFHWILQGRQIRITGDVTPTTDEEADEYFVSRPRGSQIGAWASNQSQPLESREALEGRVNELEAKFEGEPVPRPPTWSGFRIRPVRIEFWQEGPFRLHDRFLYRVDAGGWSRDRLNP